MGIETLEQFQNRESYKLLNGGVWHATQISSLPHILKSRGIEPNINGKFGNEFFVTDRSYASQSGLIAVFDFRSVPPHLALRQYENVVYIVAQKPERVLLRIDADVIADRIVPNSECWNAERGTYHHDKGGCVPHVEAWVRDTIPAKCIIEIWEVFITLPDQSDFTFVKRQDLLASLQLQ